MRNRGSYNYLHIAKRLRQCVDLNLFHIGEPVLKLVHCDEDYLLELLTEAEEIIDSMDSNLIMSCIKKLPTLPKDFPKFKDYVCYSIQEILRLKMKLDDDECVSYFKIVYEKNNAN